MKWEDLKNFLLQPAEPMIDSFLQHGLDPELSEDDVKDIIDNAIQKSLNDWRIAQVPVDIKEKTQIAQKHLGEAVSVVLELQTEIQKYNDTLNQISQSVDEKKQAAEHWEKLANVNQEIAQALTKEIEGRVAKQIRFELDRGKKRREITSAFFYLLAIFLGGVAGYYVPLLINSIVNP